MEVTYAVLGLRDGSWAPLYRWNSKRTDDRWLVTYTDTYGGYVKPLTGAEIQEDLDQMQRNWNRYSSSNRYRRPVTVRALKKGYVVGRVYNTYTCEKEVKLWSDFEHVPVPGGAGLSPTEQEEPGNRSTYVIKFSYTAYEAGYSGSIVTRSSEDEENEKFAEYPEPSSWCDHDFLEQSLSQIPWSNFKIIETPSWVGRAKSFFKHKKTRWCPTHNKTYSGSCWFNINCPTWDVQHDYPVFQNESVTKP